MKTYVLINGELAQVTECQQQQGGGKSDSPPPPDYAAAAQQTAQGNLEATRAATSANRIDQYTPYGTLKYSRDPGAFDQTKYDKDLATYNDAVAKYGARGQVAPIKSDYYSNTPDQGWRQTIELSPIGQKLLDYQNNASIGLGQQTQDALGRVRDGLSKPFDYGSVQDTQDAAYKAFTSRLDPQWQQQTQQIQTQLANQGIPVGSEAYDNAMRSFNQGKNDAYQQATIGAINTAPQTYQLAQALRSQPLNELNALRTGSQVQNPTFNNVPMQQTTAGPDMLGAANAQYQGALGANNANNANKAAFYNGLFQLGGAAMGGL